MLNAKFLDCQYDIRLACRPNDRTPFLFITQLFLYYWIDQCEIRTGCLRGFGSKKSGYKFFLV